MTIEFKDESLINSWLDESANLTAEAAAEMAATAQLLETINTESEGTLVDELINISHGVLSLTKQATGTMEEITGTIKSVVSSVSNFVDEVGGFLGNIAGGLFG